MPVFATSFKKLFPWMIAALGIAVLLFVGLVLIAPTLVNLEGVKREIETVTSREVGGTVTARHIGLSFLPRPRIVLTEPRISIPGSVEGTLSSLDIQIRLLPLLRRTVQVSSVELHKPDFTFTLRPEARPTRKKQEPKQGTKREIAALLAAFTAKTAGFTTTIDSGRIEVRAQDGPVVVVRDLVMTVLVPAGQQGRQTVDDGDAVPVFTIAGHLDRAVVETPGLPGPVSVRLDNFTATADAFIFKNASIKMLDGSVLATGSVPHYLNTTRTIELNGNGRVGARVIEWIRTRAGAPLEPVLRTPIEAKNVHVRINPGMAAVISADLKVSGGPSIAVSFDVGPDRLVLRKGEIRDAESQAEIGLRLTQQEIEASFRGMLTRSTLDSLFIREQSERRWIRGSFRARAGRSAPFLRTFDGTLEGENLFIPFKDRLPLKIRNVALSGEGNVVQIISASLVWAALPVEVKGSVTMQPEIANLDLDVIVGNLDIDAIKRALAGRSSDAPKPNIEDDKQAVAPRFPIQGEIRVAADSVSLGRFTFRPIRADIAINPGSIRLNRTETMICGIGLTGNLEFRKKHLSFDLEAEAEDKPVEETLSCFKTRDHQITGSFTLVADISGSGMADDFPRVLNGSIEVTAVNGQINRMLSMAKMLELINNTEVFRGKYPGFGNEGLKYNSISLKGGLQKGVLTVREGVMDGTTMEMAVEGSADLVQGHLDFRVAVAPLKTVDAVVKKLPFVKDILRGTLIVVPFRVTGTLSKPDVKSITLADAGRGVTGILSRTLKAPFKFVEGLVPGENGNRN